MQRTEHIRSDAAGLDEQAPDDVLAKLLDAQIEALQALKNSRTAIAKAAAAMAQAVRAGGKLGYAAAGSSALMAMADGLELPGTFGIPNDRIDIFMAGGRESLSDMLGGSEDDQAQGARDVRAAGYGRDDCLIAVSASGSTGYTVAAHAEAARAGARTVAIANNPGSPLLEAADIAIMLATPPEIIAGSTRLGAATAQKAALNMMSTLMAVELGHVHDGHMVNLRADNEKLRGRAGRMVSDIAGCDEMQSQRLLGLTDGSVKHAILLAKGASTIAVADHLLEQTSGNLRRAMAMVAGAPNENSSRRPRAQTGRRP